MEQQNPQQQKPQPPQQAPARPQTPQQRPQTPERRTNPIKAKDITRGDEFDLAGTRVKAVGKIAVNDGQEIRIIPAENPGLNTRQSVLVNNDFVIQVYL